jgi:acyl-CoA reductase-like NAD-dependent aldehyde dehydrogenase
MAAMAGYGQVTTHCGQGCVLQTRHLVHNAVRDQYVETIKGLAAQAKLGDPADPTVTMGPMIHEAQRQKVLSYIEKGLDEGGRLITGGKIPSHLQKGFYVEPTFFDQIDNAYSIAQEEIFGPVGVIIGFDTEEEAIALANDSAYGLGGGVFSADTGRAFEIAMQMRTGGVSINGGGGRLNPEVPFGGYKRSGIGREYSSEGLDEYLETKVIDFHAG